MTVAYEKYGVTVHHGDCLDVLTTLPDASIGSVVTDPPYELAFMGRAWDSSGIAFNPTVWRECMRVLKPGGYLLAFGGSRTWHRLACAIEDAGFDLRDSIAWLYGSGFPKSLDVSKAIDKQRHDTVDKLKVTTWMADTAARNGVSRADVDAHMGTSDMGGWWLSRLSHRCAIPTLEQVPELLKALRVTADEVPDEIRSLLVDLNGLKGQPGPAWFAREITQEGKGGNRPGEIISFDQRSSADRERRDIPATPHAAAWQGWGTALKPAFEPIVVARRPLAGTVAANVLAHGTGGLNIDGCRVGEGGQLKWSSPRGMGSEFSFADDAWTQAQGRPHAEATTSTVGRWPPNVVLDETAATALDEQVAGDGTSRFFPVFHWEAKAPTSERPKVNGVAHPTVKPLALMRWLVRLVTPPNGVVLDPFLGSGTTAQAARAEGFQCVGIEREATHLDLIRARLDARIQTDTTGTSATTETLSLLDLLDDGAA